MENRDDLNNQNGVDTEKDINSMPISDESRSSRRRRGRDKRQGDFSAFGEPMKAEPRTFDVQATETVTENASEAEDGYIEEPIEIAAEEVNGGYIAEKSDSGDAFGEANAEDITEEPEIEEAESFEGDAVIPEDAADSEEASEPADELAEEPKDADGPEENISEAEIAFGQIRGFGCEPYREGEQESGAEAEESESEESEEDYAISDGIQQKFDITFLEPIADVEEVEVIDEADEPEAEKEEIADIGVIEEIEKLESITEPAVTASDEITADVQTGEVSESEPHTEGGTEGTENGAPLEAEENADEYAEDSIVGEITEQIPEENGDENVSPVNPPEPPADDTVERDDIWDEDGRAEWSAREQFIEHCRGLNVPPLRTTKAERVMKRRPPQHSTTSGYQYEEAERLPFDAAEPKTPHNEKEYAAREKAFTDRRAKQERKKLNERSGKLLFKAWIMSAIAIVMLGLDCMNFVKYGGNYVITPGRLTAFCCVELVLLAISAIIAIDVLRDGISCAFRGSHIPETLTAMAVFVSLAYHAALIFIGASEQTPVIIGSPAAISVILAMVYRYYMLRRDIKAFENASPYREYATDVEMKDFPSSPEFSEFDGYAPRESELCKINRVNRIDGICDRAPVRDTCFGMMRVICIVTVCAAIAIGVAFGFFKHSLTDGLFFGMLTVALASPFSVFFSMYLPRVKAANAASEDGSAIVSYDENSGMLEKSVIMLDDSELYKASTLCPKIEVCKTSDMETRLNKVASLFRRLGGTLGTLFEDVGFEEYEEAVLREIDAHGIYATVGDSDVIAGSEGYLARYGIRVNKYDGDISEDTGVIYVASAGRFFCRIIMTFKPDLELCRRIAELRNTDTLVSLKSSNPCIDEALVYRTTEIEPELLRLIKYSSGDDVCPSPTDREGRIVSSKGSVGLFRAVLEYKRQRKRIGYGSRFALISCIAGALCAVGIIIGGEAAYRFAPLAAVGLHAVMSLIASAVAARKAIDTRTVIKKK